MRLRPDCIPCFFRQASIVATLQGADDARLLELYRGVARLLADRIDPSLSPAQLATAVHKYIAGFFGSADPFAGVKKSSNEKMLAAYDGLRKMVDRSKDPLKAAVLMSIAGNLIDYSLFEKIDLDGIAETVKKLSPPIFDYAEFRNDLQQSRRVMIVTDNAGEIVLDRLLVELLVKMGKKVIVAAKEKPILNDATVDEAAAAGLARGARLIGVGDGDVGSPVPTAETLFGRAFITADLVVSKGQANFETLCEAPGRIYFMFVTKCRSVADFLHVPENSPLLMKKRFPV